MSSIKESLHNTIELLSDQEAGQVLKFAQRLRKRSGVSLTLKQLAIDPAFKIPSEGAGVFRAVKPIQSKGIPASRFLVEDRR